MLTSVVLTVATLLHLRGEGYGAGGGGRLQCWYRVMICRTLAFPQGPHAWWLAGDQGAEGVLDGSGWWEKWGCGMGGQEFLQAKA